ncbi:hypothetical protein [Exiguobacterium sp. 17-1]|uniref:hypothetical protein n=1 Tax=Exiguobacterium sp. 17-1 TaxID=2931981 RepID=UPI00200033DF|nr:hypothetical protein [Exiguobacterium sp. 17-1]MCK2156412.1 hypothetical protein [Exiguobacterium sp. 17-1]
MIQEKDEYLRNIKISDNQIVFQKCLKITELQSMYDFNDRILKLISDMDSCLYYDLLRILSLYNLSFKGFNARLNIDSNSKKIFSFDSQTKLINVFKNEKFKLIINNLGFETIESLNGVNIEKFIEYVGHYLPKETIQKEIEYLLSEINFDHKEKGVTILDKTIYFKSNQLSIPIDTTSTNLGIINRYFIEENINLIRDLPDNLDSFFNTKKGIGISKKNKILYYLESVSNGLHDKYLELIPVDNQIVKVKFEPGELLIDKKTYDIPLMFLEKRIDNIFFAKQIKEYLIKENIFYFKELKGDIKKELVGIPQLGTKKVNDFTKFLINITTNQSKQKIIDDFKYTLKCILKEGYDLKLLGLKERNLEIFKRRYNYFEGGFKTLESVSSEYGMTREGVRQIVKKVTITMLSHFYWFWIELQSFISTAGYISDSEIDILFNSSFTKQERRFIGAILSELTDHWVYEEEGYYHTTSNEDAQLLNEVIKVRVNQLFLNKLYVTYADIEKILLVIQAEYKMFPVNFFWEKSDVKQIIIDGKTNLFLKDSLEEMAYKVYRMYFKNGLFLPKESHRFIEVLKEELPNVQFNFTARSITSYIQRTAYLWNRGYYVPKEKIKSYSIMQFEEIIKSIEHHLRNNNLFEMNINLVFESYKKMLNVIGIDNYYALHTVLKYLDPNSIYFSKVPYIRLIEYSNDEHITHAERIENYFLRAQEPVNRNKALEYFMKTIGMKQYSFDQRLTLDCHNIMQFDFNEFVHIDNLEIKEENLEGLVIQLDKEIEKFDVSLPITIIKKALLKRAKIQSYPLLFSLLKYFYPEKFTYYRYPLITKKEDVKLGYLSLKTQLETHILMQGEISYMSQIYAHFSKFGWTNNEISTRISLSEDILPVEKGKMYAHRDVLGLKDEHINYLSNSIFEYYVKNYESQNKFFITINEESLYLLQQDIDFPKLKANQLWTVDLLRSILKISNKFFTPFFKDSNLFAKENKYNLNDIESILVHILNTKFEGKATIESFEKWLLKNEMMSSKYFKSILEEEDVNYEHDNLFISVKK